METPCCLRTTLLYESNKYSWSFLGYKNLKSFTSIDKFLPFKVEKAEQSRNAFFVFFLPAPIPVHEN